MSAAHERVEFRHAVEFTVSITFVVEGAVRSGTAERRAMRVAERLASSAARAAGVVEVSARAGVSHDGKVVWPRVVCFDAANSGHDTVERGRLSRYVDPERERAYGSLAAANAAFRATRNADLARRRAAGCANRYEYQLEQRFCECVYCAPATYVAGLTHPYPQRSPHPINAPSCVCGITVGWAGARCSSHRDVQVVALEGDVPAVAQAARMDPLRLACQPDAGAADGGAR